jgi:hypothetical protein
VDAVNSFAEVAEDGRVAPAAVFQRRHLAGGRPERSCSRGWRRSVGRSSQDGEKSRRQCEFD